MAQKPLNDNAYYSAGFKAVLRKNRNETDLFGKNFNSRHLKIKAVLWRKNQHTKRLRRPISKNLFLKL